MSGGDETRNGVKGESTPFFFLLGAHIKLVKISNPPLIPSRRDSEKVGVNDREEFKRKGGVDGALRVQGRKEERKESGERRQR